MHYIGLYNPWYNWAVLSLITSISLITWKKCISSRFFKAKYRITRSQWKSLHTSHSGHRLIYKIPKNSHCKDKMASRMSHRFNGIPQTPKVFILNWSPFGDPSNHEPKLKSPLSLQILKYGPVQCGCGINNKSKNFVRTSSLENIFLVWSLKQNNSVLASIHYNLMSHSVMRTQRHFF